MIEQTTTINTHDKPRNPAITQRSIESDIVFERVNLFLQRLNDVREMIKAASDMFALEAIEIGGMRGRCLSRKVVNVLNEFQLVYNACKTNYSNILEPQNRQFDELKRTFDRAVKLFERKLSQIFGDAFENSNSIEARVKLFELIGELLGRPIIQRRMVDKTKAIMDQIRVEVETIQSMLDDDPTNKRLLVNQISQIARAQSSIVQSY